MDYIIKIDTDTTYTETAPKSTIIKMTKGRLRGGFIYFPSGGAGLLHCKLRRGLHQILPVNDGGSYALDDCVIPINIGYQLNTPPYEIEILTWNNSTSYEHTLTVGLFLFPANSVLEEKKRPGLIPRLLGIRK